MNIPIDDFKMLADEFCRVYENLGSKGFLNVERYWDEGKYVYYFNILDETYQSIDKMYAFFTKQKFIKITSSSPKVVSPELSYPELDSWIRKLATDGSNQITVAKSLEEGFNGGSLLDSKYTPPRKIRYTPLEIVENTYTYRFVSSLSGYDYGISLISRDDDKYYNYLDKEHYIFIPRANSKGDRIVIADRYDVNTAKIFVLCYLQPELADMLQDQCFTHHSTAAFLGLRMEKKLKDEFREKYKQMATDLEIQYVKHMGSANVRAFFAGETDNLSMNNINFTKNSAEYENIKIEAVAFLEDIKSFLLGNTEFDIYNVIDHYAALTAARYNKYFPTKGSFEGEESQEEFRSYRDIKINNLNVNLQISSKSYSRYINGFRIMKDDVATAISRAACYRNQEQYNLFLKSISRMSLKWHDIVSNGLRVKICSMSREELNNPIPGKTFPKIKFIIDSETRKISLMLSKERKVAINFSKFLKKVESINKKTDGKNLRRGDTYYCTIRNHTWAIQEIVRALLECCANSNDLTNQDVVDLLYEANEVRSVALAKSREFLANAVKITGAEEITFNGQQAYKVKGSLREYVVVVSTAKVYDYESKQYRCIVNDQHYVGTGYDDIATRLLTLKNDLMTKHAVATLHGPAQPGYEADYNYTPVRDNQDAIRNAVNILRPE
jgi:hypothetical protein